jgi:hypothetical protein
MDLPLEIASDIVENEDGPGPYGAKGMSEGALLPVASAVAAALRSATGVALRELPLTPERVWHALQARDRSPASAEPTESAPLSGSHERTSSYEVGVTTGTTKKP